jgi:hypothetical protein
MTHQDQRHDNKGRPPMLGRHHAERSVRKMRKAAYKLWSDPTYRKHQEWARRYQPEKDQQ